MATFKFFNIGKANEEITRLEAELATAKAEAKTATDNADEVVKNAEAVATELAQVKSDLATAKTTISSLTARAETAETEAKEAKAKIANPSEQIKNRASQEALNITASQGQPPVAAGSATEQPGGSADILAQYAAIKDPAAKTAWYRKNKQAYDSAFAAKNGSEISFSNTP